jgi:hypothetical protein
VRSWIEEQLRDEQGSKSRFFGVFDKHTQKHDEISSHAAEDKILLIAPGELYEALPLWVAEGSKCEGQFI